MWHWCQNSKNVDGGPGVPWDVSLYVPLVVRMLIKGFDSRPLEAYLVIYFVTVQVVKT
jgi:hypothetical protein